MRSAIEGQGKIQRQGGLYPAIQLTYLSYAGDISLVSQEDEQAQQLLISIETDVDNIGLQLNVKKTVKLMTLNHTVPVDIRLQHSDTLINKVTHFKYPDS